MDPRFEIEPAHADTCPQAAVPNDYVWDLVEYLAIQRVMATYTYTADRFVVTFLHMDHEAAQQLLQEWAQSYVRQHEGDRPVHGPEDHESQSAGQTALHSSR